MKKHLIYIITISFFTIHFAFAQKVTERDKTVSLPDNLKQIAKKYTASTFGDNVFIFDPTMNMGEIQTLLDAIFAGQLYPANEFSSNRYALLFKPGTYHLDIQVGYYMHIIGLGNLPDDVKIVGAVRSNSNSGGHVLCNFWRSVENLSIEPTSADTTNVWAVSQAAPLRRVHIKGNLKLFDGASSGGFMANCKVDGIVFSGSQQQWFSRNSSFGNWIGGVWNMVYMGVNGAPAENWTEKPITTIAQTPEVCEKPFLTFSNNKFVLKMPETKTNSAGIDWENAKEKPISINQFYIAKANFDNEKTINIALQNGKNILFTPGIYNLEKSLKINRKGTIIMGFGYATLVPQSGNKCIEIADNINVTVAGLLFDAGKVNSEMLMQVGNKASITNSKSAQSYLYDLFFRVGGASEGSTSKCLEINNSNVIADHLWLWRADHGSGVAWDKNRCANGLIVNGKDVTVYALFNEHFQEYQTVWNGENGRTYFYQSEMPYDPPTADAWKHGNTYGYASYKVGDHVKNHSATALGIYNVFFDAPAICDQAIETPESVENNFYHKVIFWLNGNKDSVVKSIINGKGGSINSSNRKQTMK